MISLDNLDEEMKKVSEYLKRRQVFAKSSWIKQKISEFKNQDKIEDLIYKESIITDIKEFVDTDQLKKFPSSQEKVKIEKGNIFLQINGYINIAESKEQLEKKKGENLFDVLENFESKFLQAEGEETKKVEKTVLKYEFTDGKDVIYGFEYEDLKDFRNSMIQSHSTNKFVKVLIGSTYEIRRGIIYLKKDNIRLL
jgi:hypothetical protein